MSGRRGTVGIVVSLLVWVASVPVLGLVMQEIGSGSAASRFLLAFWVLLFVGLQLAGPLSLAFTLRAAYQWRAAVCFAFATGCALSLDAAAMLGLLVWLRLRLGVG